MAHEPIKFYRPDLKFATDMFPCFTGDHECDGINGPFKCGCDCHEMSDEEIECTGPGSEQKVKVAA